jgi:SAM-dependent methyltransferase
MRYSALRKPLSKLRGTPFHPQWHAFRNEAATLEGIASTLRGLIVDVGSAEGKLRRFLASGIRHIALDYYETATRWYGTRPDVYGDAQALPFADACADCALLLDVLEHLPSPGRCLAEIHRILKPGGKLVLQVPFLYPIHDAPLDFTRWTNHGLRELARTHGFCIEKESALGHPLETAALLTNIAMSGTVLKWIEQRNPASVLALALPFLVFAINSLSWLCGRVSPADDMMPRSYRFMWVKP